MEIFVIQWEKFGKTMPCGNVGSRKCPKPIYNLAKKIPRQCVEDATWLLLAAYNERRADRYE
jgi:hypothetical protein